MDEYEKKYQKFNLNGDLVRHLLKLASKRFPFDELNTQIKIESVWSENEKNTKTEEGVVNGKLV